MLWVATRPPHAPVCCARELFHLSVQLLGPAVRPGLLSQPRCSCVISTVVRRQDERHERRVEVIANVIFVWSGAQLAVDTTFVSVLDWALCQRRWGPLGVE